MKKLIVILCLGLLVFSCKKSDRDEDLVEEDYIDSLLNIENGDTVITTFEYNSFNKLSKIKVEDITYTKLEYYPSGELGIADTYFYPGPSEVSRSYIVYTYDSSNKLKSAVVKYYYNNILHRTTTLAYTLNATDQVTEIKSSAEDVIPSEKITYDANGNIASIKASGEFESTETFTYNEKDSYLSKVSLKYYVGNSNIVRGFSVVTPLGIPVDIYNKNFKAKYTDSFSGINEEETEIEYNSAGLPVSAKVVKNHSNVVAERKYMYVSRQGRKQ